jgi:hypothetical protein
MSSICDSRFVRVENEKLLLIAKNIDGITAEIKDVRSNIRATTS